jgi:multiple sugar transport system permease protein
MQRQRIIKNVAVYTVLIWWTLMLAFPIYWLVITAFKGPDAINSGATYIPYVDFQPSFYSWDYIFVSQRDKVIRPFTNSIVVSLGAAALAVLVGSMAGYGLARYRYRVGPLGNDGIALGFLSQRMFPAAVLIIPFILMYRDLALLDTRQGLLIAYTAFGIPFVVWVMRDFFLGLPVEIEESALLDGCSRFGVLWRIALPLAAPGLVAVFVLTMIGAWNEYLFALVLSFSEAITIPLFLQIQTSVLRGTEWWNMAAIALLAVIPVVVAGFALERYITRGLTFGAVK